MRTRQPSVVGYSLDRLQLSCFSVSGTFWDFGRNGRNETSIGVDGKDECAIYLAPVGRIDYIIGSGSLGVMYACICGVCTSQ